MNKNCKNKYFYWLIFWFVNLNRKGFIMKFNEFTKNNPKSFVLFQKCVLIHNNCTKNVILHLLPNLIPSSHHHIITSSHHHIITSSHHFIITSLHHYIITSSHHHIITSLHHHIFTSSHHHIITSSHHQIITSISDFFH